MDTLYTLLGPIELVVGLVLLLLVIYY